MLTRELPDRHSGPDSGPEHNDTGVPRAAAWIGFTLMWTILLGTLYLIWSKGNPLF
jgi:hypothetical protein